MAIVVEGVRVFLADGFGGGGSGGRTTLAIFGAYIPCRLLKSFIAVSRFCCWDAFQGENEMILGMVS